MGALEAVNKRHGEFNAHDRGPVEASATWAAIAVENARLVEALRLQATQLQARNEELDAFARTVAHDLKNLLNLVIGYAEKLEANYALLSSDERQRFLQEIAWCGRKMNNIIDELLLLAGVRKTQVKLKPLDMGRIVAAAMERLADMIQEYQPEMVVPDAAAWPMALGYGPWVEEVWVNYMSNAIQYSGRPPRVELGGRGHGSPGPLKRAKTPLPINQLVAL